MTPLPRVARWGSGQIKNLAEVALGKMLQSNNSGDDTYANYMRAANVQPDGVLMLEPKQMWFSEKELDALTLRRGDVVVVEGGVGGYGRAAYLSEDLEGWGFQNSINRLRPAAHTDGRFLAYYLIALRAAGFIERYCNVVSMPHLTAEKLAAIPVPIPPADEQRAIADYLDRETARIGTLIAEQQQLVEILRLRKRAVLDGLTATAEGPRVRLKYLFEQSSEANYPGEEVLSVYRDYGVIPKSSREDNFNRTPENTSRYLLVQPGDVVINRMKAWQGSLGVSEHRGIVSGDYEVVRPIGDRLLPRFTHLYLRSPMMIAEYAVRSTGIRPSQWRLYWDQLGNIEVPVPTRVQQAAIVEGADEQTAKIDMLIAETERFIELSRERRSALITAAVTGQIDVRGEVA